MVEIITLGGYQEVGKNMTAIKYKDETVIIDMGILLDVMLLYEDDKINRMSLNELKDLGALPDDRPIKNENVSAIVLSHGHLDHIGAVSKLAGHYDAPIYGTEFTTELVKSEVTDERDYTVNNPINTLDFNKKVKVSENISIELVQITHSIPQTAVVVIHTPDGPILYLNDYKIDYHNPLGEKTDFERLRELSEQGIKAVIMESIYADKETTSPSEEVARIRLEDFLVQEQSEGIIVTTFASQIARIKNLIDLAHKIGRQPIFLGRSLCKYTGVAQNLDLLDLSGTQSVRYSDSIDNILEKVQEDRQSYMPIVTGHQGEQYAVLTRMANDQTSYTLSNKDVVVFSSRVIPKPMNEANRHKLVTKIKQKGAGVVKDLHVSGHAHRRDYKFMLDLLEPENIIPSHGNFQMLSNLAELSEEIGYKINKDVFISSNGNKITL